MSPALTIAMIRQEAALAELTPGWWKLWQESARATPFQSPAWLMAWWRAFRPGELLVATVHCGGRLVGLAPFYLERQAGSLGRLLPVGISISDYLDVLIDDEFEPVVLQAMSRAYGGSGRAWSEWELSELETGAAALGLPCPDGCTEETGDAAPAPVLMLPGSMEVLEKRLTARKRRSLHMLRNRIDRHGAVSVLSLEERAPAWWISELKRLHGARWASRGESGVLADPRLDSFHSEVLPAFAGRGLARLYALGIGDRVAGIYYGFAHRHRAYGYLTGFDPEFAYYSPGSMLVAHAIEQAIAEGKAEYHFLRGGEKYKYAWGALDRRSRRRIFREVRS